AHPSPPVYPLSLHDALPIWVPKPARPTAKSRADMSHHPSRHRFNLRRAFGAWLTSALVACLYGCASTGPQVPSGGDPERMSESRSEEHTSELQSRENLVCRL